MTVILIEPDGAAPEVGGWPVIPDSRTTRSVEDAAGAYDVVVDADHMARPPRLAGSAKIALLVTDIDALERVHGWALSCDILFAPSRLARLERLRRTRRTLVATRAVPAGKTLAAADVATEADGLGIADSLSDAAVGRRVLYDLQAGQPIDFGVLSEEKEGA